MHKIVLFFASSFFIYDEVMFFRELFMGLNEHNVTVKNTNIINTTKLYHTYRNATDAVI